MLARICPVTVIVEIDPCIQETTGRIKDIEGAVFAWCKGIGPANAVLIIGTVDVIAPTILILLSVGF